MITAHFPSIKFCAGTSKKIFRLGTVRASPVFTILSVLDEVTFLPLLEFSYLREAEKYGENRVNIRFIE
jgi:hypothetical protein